MMLSRTSRLVVTAVSLAVALTACGENEPTPFAGYERTPTPEVGDQALPVVDADGNDEPFAFRAEDGELLLVYFGYTSCPDVCPTTLADTRAAFDEIGDESDSIDLVMITIDPTVDTPDVLVPYVTSFIPSARAVWTEDDDSLRSTATAFGADYGAIDNEGQREVFHTGSLYAVDANGLLQLTWPFGTSIEDLTSDLRRLLDEVA